ncbi:MAG: hypothetical protein LBP87_06680 [Planctomycetaceae bacterium]|jgi:CRISPR/Cas system CSM-associated protein Csm4 (group 5 of RAMP superfamily)|nr:hypothetical protein [Planctomycetaceae bacterium]
MSNNNLADISTFEQLQNQTNQSFGAQSPMSVFNNAQDIVKALKKLNEIDKEYVDTEKKLEKLEFTGKKVLDMYQRLQREYKQQVKELQAIIAKGGDDAQQAAKKLESEKAVMKDAPSMPYFSFTV